jgi:hypothetical protein
MPNDLRSAIDEFAKTFAASIVASLRGASLDDILALGIERAPAAGRGPGRPKKSAAPAARVAPAPVAVAPAKRGPGRPKKSLASAPKASVAVAAPVKKSTKGGRLARRSQGQIEKALGDVVALVKKKPGLRAEQIRKELGLEAKEMPRILAEGLSSKKLGKKGEKRATAYSAK